jgi:hypothetical protein
MASSNRRNSRETMPRSFSTRPSPRPSPVPTLLEMYQREYAVLLLGIWGIDHRINNWSASQSRNGWRRRGTRCRVRVEASFPVRRIEV